MGKKLTFYLVAGLDHNNEKPNILSKSSSPVAIVIVFNMPLSKLKNDDSYYKHYVGSKFIAT